MNDTLIKGSGLVKRFGGMTAVDGVDFELRPGEILGLIGPNGAGKTTLFNLVSGFLPIDGGNIHMGGTKISGLRPDRICRLGLARTFQAARNFPDMSLRDNVRMGALFGAGTGTGTHRLTYAQADALTDEMIGFVGLERYADMAVPDLPLAIQKQLEVARALATKPDAILLDEMMAGLNPTEVEEAMALVRRVRDSGVTVLLIEHVMKAIMSICDRILVLHHGALIAEGTPQEISVNRQVIEIYLGET
ncbi:MAG: ABC transporter ATP-binding protein [Clostridiales Family XIII bacterium]|jgi:branched-chain amino acid transport system ATP-binding protein|nr:ABC transporter ATP-binding protein [Clostridiales Family XIII bacterium]